jgi:hypothetical protein
MAQPGEVEGAGARAGTLSFLAAGFTVAAALLVAGMYGVRAMALVRYPWDWSPDEGLFLGWARVLLETPGQLYHDRVVPVPDAYGPVLPVLLAPIVAAFPQPFLAARLLAAAWTGLGTWAVFRLVRAEASYPLALASAALAIAPFDLTFWHMLVRVDGPMTTLWLWAAVALLPRRLERGADRLTPARTVTGSALLLAAVLTKPTAVLHGAPLVLGWLLVDTRSAIALAGVMTSAGLVILALLELLTGGTYLLMQRFWSLHPAQPGLRSALLSLFATSTAPLLALALVGFLLALLRRSRPARDASLLLLVGGLLIVPALGKYGAHSNYFLPVLAALAVVGGRFWGGAADCHGGPRGLRILAGASVATVALALAATREFPLPSDEDGLTAGAFYSFVGQFAQRHGGPILASRPDYAYFIVHQPVEIEGSGFPILAEGHAPGSEQVLARLKTAAYTLVVEAWPLPSGGYHKAVEINYRHVGGCSLGYFFGAAGGNLFVRRDLDARFVPPPGSRCGPPQPLATRLPAGP